VNGKIIMNKSKVRAVCISEKQGTAKRPVEQIFVKASYGIEGDAHAGEASNRQVSLLANESVDKLRSKIPDIKAGAFAENILTEGIILYDLRIGTLIRIGKVLLMITQIGKECHDGACAIKQQTGDCCMPREGVFAEVIEGGIIKPGDFINIES